MKNKYGFYLVIIGVLVCLSNSFAFHSDAEPDDEHELGDDWVLVERGITWNTYYNAETGQYKTLLWSGVANYQNETGDWNPVNCTISILPPDHPARDFDYIAGAEQGVYSVYFKRNLQENWPISFAYNRSGNPTIHVLRSQLVSCGYLDPSQDWKHVILQNVQDAPGSINGDTGTYTGVFTGVNITFRYDNSLLKEEIMLSNQTRTVLENNPPSDFGLSNHDSYLVYATKLDYKNLYPFVDDVNMTGNFTVTDGTINFRNHEGIVQFAFPIDYAYEQHNLSSYTKVIYRVIQYHGDYYILAGVKVTELYQMEFPIVIDPSTTLTHTSCPADIYVEWDAGGFPVDKNDEIMMRWDISSFVNDPDIVAMNMTYIQLYCYDDRGVAADADARIAKVHDQTWVLPNVAQYRAMSETTRDDANAFNDTISTGKWVKANISQEVWSDYNDTNASTSFRLEDLDWLCQSNDVDAVANTTSLVFGRDPARITVPPSEAYVFFASSSYADSTKRPKLECIYYAVVNIPPTQTNPSPVNNSIYIETTPECSIYVDDADGDAVNVYWYNSTDGSTWTLQQTNSSMGVPNTSRWDYTQATSYSTDYYWKVAVNDTKDNTTAWYNFTTASNAAQEPISFTATTYSGHQINLTWTNYAKCERAYIEVNTSGGPVPWSWGSGTEIYNNTAANYEHAGLNYNTKYFYQAWGWNNTESAFSDENASDDATTDPSGSPAASNPNPADEEDDFNMLSIEINVTIEDPEGDPFDWTIETSPNVGSDSGNGESNGSKTCSVTLTQSKVLHTWWVNATDGLGGQLNQSYEFTTNWYPEMYNPYPVDMSINTEGTPTLRITINDTDADDLFCFMQSNYTGSWTSLESWFDIDMSGGEVTKTHIATVFSEPDTKYWWRIYLYDYYHIIPPPFDFGGENISTYHFTTCSLPTISSASPANENMNETSPVTLSAYFEQPQGIVMNITWYDYESETVLETDSNKNNDTQTYVWTREAGTGEWNITVESHNFTITSDKYWFANNQTWDDDFNNSFLADNLSGSDTYLIPLTDDSTCRYESWYDSTLSAGNEANVTIDAAMTDATLNLSYGKDTVFINDTHGYAFFSKGGTITVSNTTDGGSIWSASTDSGETSRTISVWWDGWIYNDNNTNNIIHCNIGTTDDDDVKYAKFWINNDTFSSWTTIHDFSADSDYHRSSICTTSRGDIWVGYYHGTTGDSYIKMSEDGGVTWTQMLIDLSNGYYSVYPLGDKGVMVLHCDDDIAVNAKIYATYYLYSTKSWSDEVLLVSTGNADEFVGHDAVYYDKEGELYFTAISNDYAAGAAVYFRKFWISNYTWSSSKTVANGYTTKSTIAVSQGTGDIYIAYMDGTLGAEDVYSVNSTDGGNTWGAESQLSNINDDLRFPSSSYYGYERLYFTWVNDDLNDFHGCTVRTYTKGSSLNYWGNLTSIAMTKPTGCSWDQFFATGTEFTNLSFSILDSNNVTLLSGLDGDFNDISGVADATIRLFANFSNTSAVGLWNVTWTGPLSITINFVGNLSDRGGPYWRPPGESDLLDEAGEGIFRDGYYTNDSKQQEDWIYINTTVSAGDGTVDEVWLHWYNITGGTWVNNSYQFVNTAGDYYEYNTSGCKNVFPYGMTTYGNYIWVNNPVDDKVYKYSVSGGYIENWSISGSGNSDSYGITTNGNYIWVTDYTDAEVYKYDMDGVYTNDHWDTAGSGNGNPYGITANNTYIWVTDINDAEVYKYDMDGVYTNDHWDTAGSGNDVPYGITTNDSYIWVTDPDDPLGIQPKVYKYDMDGVYIGNWGTSGGNAKPKGITTDDNYIWIVDSTDAEVYKYDMDGVYTGINWSTIGNIQTCEGFDYSFDIRANDTSNNILITWWNKTGLDGSITRRSVQLNCITLVNISYTPFYFYNLTGYVDGASGGQDRFIHDQGMSYYVDSEYLVGQIADTLPGDAVSERHGLINTCFWYNGTGNIQPIKIYNIFFYIWWSALLDDLDAVGWSSERGSVGAVPDEYYGTNISYRHSSIYYDNGFDVVGVPYNHNYSLDTHLLDITDTNFTDNNIYELLLHMTDSQAMPSIICNISFKTCAIFNVPDNATLNASHPDTDSDGLSDWYEFYRSHTLPHVSDTDADGVNDYWEHYGSSDPNNYTSTANDSLVFEINRTSFGFGTVQNDTIEYSNETGEADTLRIYNNGTCDIDIDIHGTNATASGVADWVLSPNNGDNLYKMEVYNVTTNWWQVNLTEDTWYTNMLSSTNITANIRVTTPITFYSGKQMSCTIYMSASIH